MNSKILAKLLAGGLVALGFFALWESEYKIITVISVIVIMIGTLALIGLFSEETP